MKVTMQQTVELEEVPLHINKVLLQAVDQLRSLIHIAGSLDVTKSDQFVESLDFVRNKMLVIDTKFDECAGLMKGFKSALRQLEENNISEADQQLSASTSLNSEKVSETIQEDTVKQYKDFVQNMPNSMDDIKDLYETLYKEKNLHTQNPIPPFPDLDMSALGKKKNQLEELLENE